MTTGPDGKGQRSAGPAVNAVRARLADQVEEIERQATQARSADPEAVHQMRVALRRLRSALATFRPLVDRDQTDPLREEMRWIASELGVVRDLHVTHERFREILADQPQELVIGPVQERIDEHMLQELRAGEAQLAEAMLTQRYVDLIEALQRLAERPPWVAAAHGAGDDVLRQCVRKDVKRLSRAVSSMVDAPPEQRPERLHEVRKAAKRARYAAETVEPRLGRDAARFAVAAKTIQTILGDHHDRVTEMPKLRDMGIAAHIDGESAFTFGRLHAHEEHDAERLEGAFDAAWRRASRRKLRRWLR